MQYEITSRWTGRAQFACELDDSYKSKTDVKEVPSKAAAAEKEEPKPEPPKPDDQTGDGQEEGTNDDDKGTQSGDGKEGQSASDEGQE